MTQKPTLYTLAELRSLFADPKSRGGIRIRSIKWKAKVWATIDAALVSGRLGPGGENEADRIWRIRYPESVIANRSVLADLFGGRGPAGAREAGGRF